MQHADIAVTQGAAVAAAVVGALAIAWIADMLAGRRGLGGAILVAGVGAACAAFLAIRVFGVATLDSWLWVIWSLAGAALSMGAFYLFRNKR